MFNIDVSAEGSEPTPKNVIQPVALISRSVRTKMRTSEAIQIHRKLMSFHAQELERQHDNRKEQAIDFDFYDNEQWDRDEAAVLLERGQKPLVFNIIATSIDWITGSEKRARTDFKVLPRTKEGGKASELKTDTLKYLADTSNLEFHRSRAFDEAVKGGIGWLEDQWQGDGGDEPVYSRFESWRNMLWDSSSTEMDLSDARYIFRSKWVDVDVAVSWFPDMEAEIKLSSQVMMSSGTYGTDVYGDDAMDSAENDLQGTHVGDRDLDYTRARVRLIEAWYKVPGKMQFIKGGQFHNETYDPTSRGQINELSNGDVVVASRTDMQMRCAIMTPDHLLFDAATPYRHNRFPFTPIWGFRRNKNNLPYGVIRRLRDPQSDVNHRASKIRHILATSKTFMEEGAVEDLDRFQEEISRPDSTIVYKAGKKFEYNADRELAPAHMELMSRSMEMIQQVGGVTDENLGRRTNATSGIAIGRRQEQGALATAGLFDNLLLAKKTQGGLQLSLIEQYYSENKTFRITNKRGVPQYVTINGKDEAGAILPENDITASKADYIISEDEWSASVRAAKTQELIDVIQVLGPVMPEVVLTMVDFVFEGMDIANRDEIVMRIRQLTGLKDPDQTEDTPEQQAMDAKKAEAEDRAIRMEEASIAEKEASAAQKSAAAATAEVTAKNVLASMAGTNVATQKAALEAALAMIQVPQAVPIADAVAREAGFVSRGEVEDDAAVDSDAASLEQMAAEGAAMEQQAAIGALPPEEQQMPPLGATQPPVGPEAAPTTQPPMI